MGLNYYDIATLPHLYDIVWCRFPEEGLAGPGTKLRPALVRGVKLDASTGRGAVRVSYGTSNLKLIRRSHLDLIIQNAAALQVLGLAAATRFDLERDNWLPWCFEFFCSPPHSDSIIAGSLDAGYIGRLRTKLKRRGAIK